MALRIPEQILKSIDDPPKSTISTLESLPIEILLSISTRLRPTDQICLALSSKHLASFTTACGNSLECNSDNPVIRYETWRGKWLPVTRFDEGRTTGERWISCNMRFLTARLREFGTRKGRLLRKGMKGEPIEIDDPFTFSHSDSDIESGALITSGRSKELPIELD